MKKKEKIDQSIDRQYWNGVHDRAEALFGKDDYKRILMLGSLGYSGEEDEEDEDNDNEDKIQGSSRRTAN